MNEFVSLAVALATLWLVLIGGAFVVNRRDWATTVFAWPFRTAYRFTRWAIGSSLVALGNAIRGGGQHRGGGHHDRRRH